MISVAATRSETNVVVSGECSSCSHVPGNLFSLEEEKKDRKSVNLDVYWRCEGLLSEFSLNCPAVM